MPFLMAMAQAQAAGPSLAHGAVPGAGEVRVSADDVEADVQRIPPDARARIVKQPNTMRQLVTNLYTRRALAQRAQAQGLAQKPEVAAALALARDKVLSDALLVEVDQSNTPSDARLLSMARTMYQASPADFHMPEQVHIRHILVSTREGDAETAKAKAQDILVKLRAGADFAALAKQHSADPGSADKGGDLGFFAKGRMVPEFDEAAFALQKAGDLTEVIKTQFGYHVLQLVARKPAGPMPFEEAKEALLAKVRQSEQQRGRIELAKTLEDTMKLDESAILGTVEKLLAPVVPAKP